MASGSAREESEESTEERGMTLRGGRTLKGAGARSAAQASMKDVGGAADEILRDEEGRGSDRSEGELSDEYEDASEVGFGSRGENRGKEDERTKEWARATFPEDK